MNIYLLNEDGNSFCVRAETMSEACKISLEIYLRDEEDANDEVAFNREDAIAYYHEEILQSCTLLGELKN